MAMVFQLTDGTTTLNFLTDETLFRRPGMFEPTIDNFELIWDSFECGLIDTDTNNLDLLQTLQQFRTVAIRYMEDELMEEGIWWKWNVDGEIAKQTLVTNLDYSIISDGRLDPLMGQNALKILLSIEHYPFYESETTINFQTGIGDYAYSLGGTVTPTASGYTLAGGDMLQRVSNLAVWPIIATPTDDYNEVWLGIREINHGTSDFMAFWSCTAGTYVTGHDASGVSDGDGKDSDAVEITFTNYTDMQSRFYLAMDDFFGIQDDNTHQIGTYMLLGRVKLDAATTEVLIRIKTGSCGDLDTMMTVGDVVISGVDDSTLTGYRLVPLGVINIPTSGHRGDAYPGYGGLDDWSIAIWASRLSASGSIRFDTLTFIPYNHYMHLKGNTDIIDWDGTFAGALIAKTSFDGYVNAFGVGNSTSGYISHELKEKEFNNLGFPHDGGLIVIASQGADSHILESVMSLDIRLARRFSLYSGTSL